MTFQEFDLFFDSLIDEARKMRDTKGREYANSTDRFDNFNRLSASNNISRLKVANILLSKHIDSINSYVKEERTFSEETIRGRFIDVIVYAALMAGMAAEQHDSKVIHESKIETTVFPPINNTVCKSCGVSYLWHITKEPMLSCTTSSGNHIWVAKNEESK